jgi:putative addiction module component (TIGR02574 family)
MNIPATLSEIASLSVDERLSFVEAIWETIVTDPAQPELTEAQRQALERRLADHAAFPDQVTPWEEVKAQALARVRR